MEYHIFMEDDGMYHLAIVEDDVCIFWLQGTQRTIMNAYQDIKYNNVSLMEVAEANLWFVPMCPDVFWERKDQFSEITIDI